MEEKQSHISNRDRIIRVLQKVSEASFPLFIRTSKDKSVAVKGRFGKLVRSKAGGFAGFTISDISNNGMKFIGGQRTVQIEFIMTTMKLVATVKILRIKRDFLIVSLPNTLTSIERRKNSRFKTTESTRSSLALDNLKPNPADFTLPPMFPQFEHLGLRLPIADISVGGVCIWSNYPGINNHLYRGLFDDMAFLHLPMRPPIQIGVEIRWKKVLKEHLQKQSGTMIIKSFRYGCEFLDMDEDKRKLIGSFIRQLQQSEGI